MPSLARRLITGMRTTGPSHLGHYVGALRTWRRLQDDYECFFLLANVQALSTHYQEPEMVAEAVREVALDWLAVGLDPSRPNVHFVLQSRLSEVHELAAYLSFLVPLSYVDRNPTIKTERRALGARALNLGFYAYPVSQAADILLFSPVPAGPGDCLVVPVGEDQVPHIELTNDIAGLFNRTYRPVLVQAKPLLSEVPRLVGTDGRAKMSKSLNNAIFLKDDEETLRQRVMSMFTDPTRLRATDPGHVEGNPVFVYHDTFNPDREEVEDLKQRYRLGRVGDVEVKQRLFRVLNNLLGPIRERRMEWASRPGDVAGFILAGTERAREVAGATMEAVRSAMKLDYAELPHGTARALR